MIMPNVISNHEQITVSQGLVLILLNKHMSVSHCLMINEDVIP